MGVKIWTTYRLSAVSSSINTGPRGGQVKAFLLAALRLLWSSFVSFYWIYSYSSYHPRDLDTSWGANPRVKNQQYEISETQCCIFLAENWVELREKKKKIVFIWSREINIVANVKSEVFWLKPYRGWCEYSNNWNCRVFHLISLV